MNNWPEGFALGKARYIPFPMPNLGSECAGDHAQDSVVAAYEAWMGRTSNQLSKEEKKTINKAIKEANERGASQNSFEYHFTPKSIEQSADRKTVVVLWNDRTKTIVRLSENDKDDIDTAFAYALAKKCSDPIRI